jgi:hypothetical protein
MIAGNLGCLLGFRFISWGFPLFLVENWILFDSGDFEN